MFVLISYKKVEKIIENFLIAWIIKRVTKEKMDLFKNALFNKRHFVCDVTSLRLKYNPNAIPKNGNIPLTDVNKQESQKKELDREFKTEEEKQEKQKQPLKQTQQPHHHVEEVERNENVNVANIQKPTTKSNVDDFLSKHTKSKILFTFEDSDEDYMSVKKDDLVYVSKMSDDKNWLFCVSMDKKKKGWVPSNFVVFYKPE